MAYQDIDAGIALSSEAVEVVRLDVAPLDAARLRGDRRSTAAAAPPRDTALEETLWSAGFDIASILALTPLPVRRGDVAGQIEVAIGPDEDAVLLVESADNILRWHLPAEHRQASGRRDGSTDRAALFDLHPNAAADDASGRRGRITEWIGGALFAPVKTYILRFAARKTIDLVVDRVEGDLVTGPVALTAAAGDSVAALAGWKPHPLPPFPGKRIRRLLLLVHGTFSTTAGSFGALLAHPDGQAFLAGAASRYDLILGYDHKTLAETPAQNAAQILAALTGLRLDAACTIDAIAFSRGGLVYRTLAEQLYPGSGLKAKLGTAVFVGCTNAGTYLARPANWLALVDLYTNVTLAATRGLDLATGGGFALIAAPVIRTLGRFVQLLPDVAIAQRYTPGLAAMDPDGAVVHGLNAASYAACPARYHAITASFEPRDAGARGMGKALARFVIDRVADRLQGTPNDLVVNTASMTDLGTARGWIDVADAFAFGDTPDIYHTIYFGNVKVAQLLSGWLLEQDDGRSRALPEGSGRRSDDTNLTHLAIDLPSDIETFDADDADDAAEAADTAVADEGEGDAAGHEDIQHTPASLITRKVRSAKPDDDPGASVDRFVGAEMQQYPRRGVPVNLFVTLSPQAIADAGHAAAAATDAAVSLRRGATTAIEVLALENCRVIGAAVQEVDLSATEQTVRFMVEGLSAGSAKVLVELRQDEAVRASLTLAPEFIDAQERVLRASQMAEPARPRDARSVVLRIYEFSEGEQIRRLRFDLQGDGFAESIEVPPPPLDLRAHMRGVLKEFEDAWRLDSGDGNQALYRMTLANLINEAKSRTQDLLPNKVLELLWAHQGTIDSIQVISDNPSIPWELMYLSDPSNMSDEPGGFLTKWGVTRWVHGASRPENTLALAGARSRYVIPEYRGGISPLAGAEAERTMFADRFEGAEPVTADSGTVADFLRNDAAACDVLHFACHGSADTSDGIAAHLAMRGIPVGDRVVADPLTFDTVRQNVRFGPGPRRALVFLNACQAGQAGYGLSGTAGFAQAFIRPTSGQGAAAFIGALWSIDDRLALTFADRFYAALDGGATLAEASKQAREASQENADFTWLAYTVYGAPDARKPRR